MNKVKDLPVPLVGHKKEDEKRIKHNIPKPSKEEGALLQELCLQSYLDGQVI